MQAGKFENFVDGLVNEIKGTLSIARREYSNDSNVFGNFIRLSNMLHMPKEIILFVYLMKHIDGITSFLAGQRMQRENIKGRIIDAICYLIILCAMFKELEEEYENRSKETTRENKIES